MWKHVAASPGDSLQSSTIQRHSSRAGVARMSTNRKRRRSFNARLALAMRFQRSASNLSSFFSTASKVRASVGLAGASLAGAGAAAPSLALALSSLESRDFTAAAELTILHATRSSGWASPTCTRRAAARTSAAATFLDWNTWRLMKSLLDPFFSSVGLYLWVFRHSAMASVVDFTTSPHLGLSLAYCKLRAPLAPSIVCFPWRAA
mmetsp:Transcript_96927/g.167174  ORF Transcript_96927/g.167174 Transcript_96927/m.167174 type:complete len:206 (+) Transcript_96927:1552-2169(+)